MDADVTLEARIDACAEEIRKEDNTVLNLRLIGRLTMENTQPLVDALAEHGHQIEEITLDLDSADDGVLAAMLAPMRDNGKLEYIHLKRVPPGPIDAQALADLIGSRIPLRTLELNETGLDDAKMIPIMQALAAQPGIRDIDISQNPIREATIDAALPVLAPMHDLTTFHFNFTDMPIRRWDDLDRVFNQTPHPNLVFCSAPLESELSERQSKSFLKLIQSIPTQLADFANFPLENFQQLEQFKPGIQAVAKGDMEYLDRLRDYRAHLRFCPKPEAETLDALLKPNFDKITPLHQPRLFRDQPELLDKLLASGELNAETLDKRTPQDFSILEHLAAFAPPEQTLATLAKHGILPSTPGLWQDDDGAPTRAFELLCGQESGLTAFFDHELWLDASKQDVVNALSALDDATRAAIPNRHALLASKRATPAGVAMS